MSQLLSHVMEYNILEPRSIQLLRCYSEILGMTRKARSDGVEDRYLDEDMNPACDT